MHFVDLTKQYQNIRDDIGNAIARVLESSVFIGGDEVETFEKEIAKYCGTRYAIGVNSGTDALLLSLKALGIGSGDEVITTPFTFIATAEVIASVDARPVFVDIDPITYNIDINQIKHALTSHTKAVIPVHLYGQLVDMNALASLTKERNIVIIEDACQAIGASYNGKRAGNFGKVGCFSFFPSKNLGTCGDGGIITTNDESINEKLRLLRNHGSSPQAKYKNIILGTNSRLDAIHAAILRVKLKYLNKWNDDRNRVAKLYTSTLNKIPMIRTPVCKKQYYHVYHQYTIRVIERELLKNYLIKKNIPTMIYYPIPLHLQPAFAYLGYHEGDFPNAEKAASEVLSLPIFPEITSEQQMKIAIAIQNFYENHYHIRS